MLGEIGIVIKARNLQPAELELAGIERFLTVPSLSLELRHDERINSRHGLCSGKDGLKIHGLAKTKIVRVKYARAGRRAACDC